jgi:hypothetical protein
MKKDITKQGLKNTFEKLLNESFTKEECLTKGNYLINKFDPEKARALLEKKQFGSALWIFDTISFNKSFDKWLFELEHTK